MISDVQIRAGLSLYSLLGGLAADTRFRRLPRARWEELDGLRTDGLRGVFRYFDGQTDDARLVRTVLQSARDLGARTALPAEHQDTLLVSLEAGTARGSPEGPIPSPLFFETLRVLTVIGFLADPKHGGNRDFAGWKSIGIRRRG